MLRTQNALLGPPARKNKATLLAASTLVGEPSPKKRNGTRAPPLELLGGMPTFLKKRLPRAPRSGPSGGPQKNSQGPSQLRWHGNFQ